MKKQQKPFCKGITRKQEPCTSTILYDGTYCLYHSPVYRPQLLKQTKAAAHKPRHAITILQKDVKNSSDLYEFIGELLTDVRRGKIKMSGKQAIATVNALGKLLITAEETAVIDKRLKQLEQAK